MGIDVCTYEQVIKMCAVEFDFFSMHAYHCSPLILSALDLICIHRSVDQSGQTGFGLFAPKKANFPPQMLTHTTAFRILGGKLSRLKCDLSVLDQSGQVDFEIFHSQKALLDQSGQVDFGVFHSVKLGIFPISCQHWHPIISL